MAPKKDAKKDAPKKEAVKEAPKKEAAPAAKKEAPKKEAAPKAVPKAAAPAKKKSSKKDTTKKSRYPTKSYMRGVKYVKQEDKNGKTGIYVKGLDFPGMSHETVREVFKQYQKITEVRLRHGKYVLVFFDNAAAAAKAVEMNDKTVRGNKITVQLAKRVAPTRPREEYCKTIWVSPLPGGTTAKQLKKHFHEAGKIIRIRVYKEKQMGFVYFEDNATMLKALAMGDKNWTHGKDPMKRKSKIPLNWQRKLTLRPSIRTKAFDAYRNQKRYNRAPASVIAHRVKKHAARLARNKKARSVREAKAKSARKAEAAKAAIPVPKKGSKTKKGSSTDKSTEKKPKTRSKGKGNKPEVAAPKPKAEKAEKPKAEKAEKPKAEKAEKPKAEKAEKPKAEKAEKPKAEKAAEKPKAEKAAEKPKADKKEKPAAAKPQPKKK
eukprot:NODE_315_length_1490_cov_1269.042332_g228_i0.p1 GENE.NODE_315_length_1490_cov_1269.042332_g228_i0~~NODE_315_length_1490_cov_1269.042332_g228_i0.p1  ORF type:complete len:433 (+),score=240.10 NODE_315_length_1490_cov_1269.042332_g228_i0:86-1384(+)